MKVKLLEDSIYLYYAYISGKDIKFDWSHHIKELPEIRKTKVNNFVFEKDKLLSTGAWVLLKKALNDFNIELDYSNLSFGQFGKPYLVDKPIEFNISHSGSAVFCALSNSEVGYDVEEIKEYDKNLASYCMNSSELDIIEAGNDCCGKSLEFLSFLNFEGKHNEMSRFWFKYRA